MKNILLIICMTFLFYSCSSNDDSNNQDYQQEQDEPSFYALKVGNSWVYKSFRYDLNEEVYNETEIIDSVSVVGIEDILGITYFKFRTKTTGSTDSGTQFSNANGVKFDYYREIDGNLVNENNEIIFTTTDYSEHEVITASWGSIFEKLAEELSNVEVPSGTFLCYNKERYARTPEGDPMPSMDNFYYAEGIGLIYDSISFLVSETPMMIRQLDSYNVQ